MKQPGLFVVFEFVFGLLFAIAAGLIFFSLDKHDLFPSILYGFIIMYCSSIIGITLIGYFHFRTFAKLKSYWKAVGFCVAGLVCFLILYVIFISLTHGWLPYRITSMVLPVLVPIIGGLLGFNSVLWKDKTP